MHIRSTPGSYNKQIYCLCWKHGGQLKSTFCNKLMIMHDKYVSALGLPQGLRMQTQRQSWHFLIMNVIQGAIPVEPLSFTSKHPSQPPSQADGGGLTRREGSVKYVWTGFFFPQKTASIMSHSTATLAASHTFSLEDNGEPKPWCRRPGSPNYLTTVIQCNLTFGISFIRLLEEACSWALLSISWDKLASTELSSGTWNLCDIRCLLCALYSAAPRVIRPWFRP